MNQLLPSNFTRCNNDKCTNKTDCKRFLQYQLDKTSGVKEIVAVEYQEKKCERKIPLV